ncbi:MAG: DNA polymerase III subunit beta [bacterium]
MKITINTKEFKNGLKKIEKGLATKATMPIIKGILIKATDTITLVSNNLEIGISTTVEGDVIKEGCVVIPGSDLIKYINKVTTTDVTLTVDENYHTEIKSRGKYKISGYNPDEFPSKKMITETSTTVSQGMLKEALDKVDYAVSNDNTQPMLTAVKLFIEDGSLGSVATNTYRLSLFNDLLSEEEAKNGNHILIPSIAADTLTRLLGNGDVTITYDKSHIEFVFDNITLQSRLIDGQKYPNYKQILVNDFVTELIVDKLQLQNAVEIAKQCNESSIVRLEIEGEKMTIAGYGDKQEYIEDVDIEKDGEDLGVNLDGNYVLDYLKSANSETVMVRSAGSLKQWVFTESNDDLAQCIIMPVIQP